MNNTERTIALLQDIQGVITEIQPLLTDGKVADLRHAASLRSIRQQIGETLEQMTNGQAIIDGYRADAINCMAGVTKLMISHDNFTDNDLRHCLLGLDMAAERIRHYFDLAAKEAPTCEAG